MKGLREEEGSEPSAATGLIRLIHIGLYSKHQTITEGGSKSRPCFFFLFFFNLQRHKNCQETYLQKSTHIN